MKNMNRPIKSREYKLMLNADRFANRSQGVQMFWDLHTFFVQKQGNQIYETQDEVLHRRTWYLDTPNFELRRRGATLRVRDEADAKKRYKVTLKYRNADRYVAASQDLSSTQKIKPDNYKFEEDILPPFSSKFAHSASLKAKKLPELATMSDMVKLFPGVSNLAIPEKTPLLKANNFTAYEVTHRVGKFKFDSVPIARGTALPEYIVKACMNFWYLLGESDELPLVAEFSFDYDVTKSQEDDDDRHLLEEFSPTVVAGTNRFFTDLQKQVGWLAVKGTTKTSYAFEAL